MGIGAQAELKATVRVANKRHNASLQAHSTHAR
jgi:hypothetical protein